MSTTKTRTCRNRINRVKAAENMPAAILLKKKAICDAKALEIVKRLIEPAVDVKWLLNILGWINRSHLEDVADERAIEKICGYVLCDNQLMKVVNKKYHISSLKNKVYDVEMIKNFCSFTCYSAMNHLMMQMLTSPLWLRDEEDIPKFTLLDKPKKRTTSPPGIEINITGLNLPTDKDDILKKEESEQGSSDDDNIKENKKIISKRQKVKKIRSRNENNIIRYTGNDKRTNKYDQNSSKINFNDETLTLNKLIGNSNNDDNVNTENVSTMVFNNNEVENVSEPINDKKLNSTSQESIKKTIVSEKRKKIHQKPVIFTETLTSRLKRCFDEWITKETYDFLCSKGTDKNDIIKKFKFNDKYTALYEKIDMLQFEDDDEEQKTVAISENLRPVPTYVTLQKQTEELEIKVRAFYSGQLETMIPTDNSEEEKNNQKPSSVIPVTDARAPNVLRRRIFLDKLNKKLPDVLQILTESDQMKYLYSSKCMLLVKTLVSTFNLTANNIVFKTAEWTLISILIIKMLGLVDSNIEALLLKKDTEMYLSRILTSYQLELKYINNLINRFTISPKVSDIKDSIGEY